MLKPVSAWLVYWFSFFVRSVMNMRQFIFSPTVQFISGKGVSMERNPFLNLSLHGFFFFFKLHWSLVCFHSACLSVRMAGGHHEGLQLRLLPLRLLPRHVRRVCCPGRPPRSEESDADRRSSDEQPGGITSGQEKSSEALISWGLCKLHKVGNWILLSEEVKKLLL